MSAFWNVIVSNAHWMFGPGGALLLLGAYLLSRRPSKGAQTTRQSVGGVHIGGDVVNGNKITSASTGLIALALGAFLCLAVVAILMAGGGDHALSLGPGVANTGDNNKIKLAR